MKVTNIGFLNGKRYREFVNYEAGYYDYEAREEAECDAINDETQFDTTDETELALLWWEFCKENDVITYVEEVEVEE